MCEYIKSHFPNVYLYTSTNGLALSEAQARRLVHSGIDEVTFSIDGATPETYAQYRQETGGWISVPLTPELVYALAAGNTDGLAVMDGGNLAANAGATIGRTK